MNNAFLLSVFGVLLIVSCAEKEKGIKPEYRDLTEAVYSTVTVQPRQTYTVYPEVSGIIEYLNHEEGDTVFKGDVLLEIKDSKSDVKVRSAQLQYEIAKEKFDGKSAQRNELEEQIATAKEKLTNDSLNYERQKRLWKQNIGSQLDFEQRKLAYEASKNDLEQLINAYHRSTSELQRQVEIAKNTLQINQLNSGDFVVRVKMDGLIYSLEKEVGESVTPQTQIAVIGSASDFILELLIDEVDISKVYPGQTVIFTLDAYPNRAYEAEVSKIYPEKDERTLTFKVEAEFREVPERLMKGLSGEANIIIAQKSKVLTLPSQFVSANNTVETMDGRVSIETGLRSLEFTEVVNGIDSGTVVKMIE